MAVSNERLAEHRLEDVVGLLTKIVNYLDPTRREAAAADDRIRHEQLLSARLIGLCEAAHLTVEGCLKAVGTLAGVEAKLLYAHDVGAIADALPPEERDAMLALIASSPGLVKTPGYISMWRTKGVYRTVGEGMTTQEIATPAFATAITAIAADVAATAEGWLARRGVEPAGAATLRAYVKEIRDHVAHIDLGSGEPRTTDTP